MTEGSIERKAWLDRIGYSGSTDPTLATLNKLIFAHSHAIAYESLDIMLGRTPKLDIASLQRKMVSGGRGGYCLEQNMLFREGLRSLGYNVTSLQGRVVRGMAIDAPRPAIHMLLQVNLPDGPYLADVGFGNLAPTSALMLREGIEQDTLVTQFRLERQLATDVNEPHGLMRLGAHLPRHSVPQVRRRV